MIIQHGLLDGQVLQRLRNQMANSIVRGTCETSGEVRATIRHKGKLVKGWGNRKIGSAARGKFAAKLTGIPVGGPYEITLTVVGRVPSRGGHSNRATSGDVAYNTESVTAYRIWVGDVWLLAGQSNMQGCGNLRTAPKPHPLVHAMYMDDHWNVAKEPIHFLPDSPDPVHYEAYGKNPSTKAERNKLFRATVKGVCPGIFFGKEMVKRSGGVPQGLLCTAHGGTSMEQWDPAKKNLGGRSLYGSMLRSWSKTGQPVAGVLWYQGESDCIEAAAPLYTGRMKRFVAAMRRDLKQPNLPFLLVQIGKVFGIGWDAKCWNSVQDQQVKLKELIRNYDVVATIDLPLDDLIHVGTEGYARLGVRLARLADRMVYGNRKELPAPALASLSTTPTKAMKGICVFPVTMKFKNVVGGLRAGSSPTGFTIINDNHQDLQPVYKTTINGNVVQVETMLPVSNQELHLMYGHGTAPYVNITDARDMAIPVFRTLAAERTLAVSPFVVRWLISSIQPATIPVHKQSPPKPHARLQLKRQAFEQPFVDQHLVWEGKKGQAYFFSEINLSEPMKLNVRVGYDGPIKVWIDSKPVFADPKGTNPAVPDQGIKPVSLGKGRHRIAVAMDLHDGLAWGFFLRFDRRGLSKARIASGKYAVPVCSL
ncbi:MAG: sialate O-acetylesterase [Verrucomicrobiae bacterium]|nr:sialate O-acetylesterase [Verrucomicrobiae bacterium]